MSHHSNEHSKERSGEQPSKAVHDHREAAPESVRVAVLTISDTRTEADDTGGDALREILTAAGHEVVARGIVKDEARFIRKRLVDLLADSNVEAVVTTGGTGISARDTTYEVAERMISRRIDGFGELFRMLSYEEVGAAAMLSRAIAGEAAGKFLACLPGSSNAVRLGTEKLLVPEISHVVFEIKKHRKRG